MIFATIPNRCEKKHHLWMLNKCLESLFDFEPSLAHRVFIVDDHSTIDIMPTISKYPVKLIKHKERVSYASMMNTSIKVAESMGGDTLITINNDIEHKMRFLKKIEDRFDEDRLLYVIGALLFYPTGFVQHGGVDVSLKDGPTAIDPYRNKGGWDKERYVHAVTGAWSAIRLKPLNFYDEKFPFNYEDVDFCLRAWTHGYKTMFTPDIAHVHYESVTKNKTPSARVIESARQFYETKYDFEKINKELQSANQKANSS